MSSEPTLIKGSDGALAELIEVALQSIGTSIGTLIDKPVVLQAGALEFLNADLFSAQRAGKYMLLTGDLEKDYAGPVHILLGLTEAITFSSYMMRLPDEVIQKNREEEIFSEENQETFGEVGNIIFSALDEALRGKAPGAVNIRVKDQENCELPGEAPKSFTQDPFVLYSFSCKVAEFAEAEGAILIPLEAAEKINGEPLNFGELEGPKRALKRLENSPEDEIEDIEQAPIQGRLATYVQDGNLFKKIRKSCRRIGLELEKRPKTEVPNPSAHRGKIVLIEVGRGELKRFEWCRRLKESGEIHVAIMLMEATQYTVALAYKAGADVIVGWPVHERRLSAKLASIFEEEGSETTEAVAESA